MRSSWSGCDPGYEFYCKKAGIRLDLAVGTLCLPDEVRIFLTGRRPPCRATMQAITVADQYVVIPVGKLAELKIGVGSPKSKLWVRHDPKWVQTVTAGPGQIRYFATD